MRLSMHLLCLVLFAYSCQFKQKKQEITDSYYTNKYHFHFSPPENWMNDPNGMVYLDGEYHLFYQHYPDTNIWGPMHWGHAVSMDLVHWEHLPIALYPDKLGFIFSGSAVIDHENTSGFGEKNNPPMVAIFTYHDQKAEFAGSKTYQSQALAYSLDKGRTWTKYSENPVLKSPGMPDFRDPKVSWNEEEQKWIMVLAVKDHVTFYSSKNLKDWTWESDFGTGIGAQGGVWECPDLFTLKDSNGETKWVMLVSINPGGPNGGSATQYFVGDFDGKTFVPSDTKTRWLDYGADNYAGVTWSNIPQSDGRRLFIGWMSNWMYANKISTVGRQNAMTLPRKLSLVGDATDYRLRMEPVEEVEKLYLQSRNVTNSLVEDGVAVEMLFALEIDFRLENASGYEVLVSNSKGDTLRLLVKEDEITLDRSKCGRTDIATGFAEKHSAPLQTAAEHLKIFVDRSSIEVFANNGESVISDVFFTETPLNKISITNKKNVSLKSATVTPLKSIWTDL